MRKVWVDTDPGVDDTFALAMLFEAKDKIDIIGMSSVFGNVEVEKTTRNAKLILEAVGREDIPLARGAAQPLGVLLETGAFVHGKNGMGDMPLPEPAIAEMAVKAPQAIIDVILSNPNEITLFPIGPLTNIAMAYLLEPKIAQLVKEVVIMGGAVREHGNVTPAAEANFYHDPHAAQIVIRAGWPIVMAGLDVCNKGFVPLDLVDKICSADKPLAKYLKGAVPHFLEFLKTINVFEGDFPDALAAGYLLAPEIFTIERVPIFVETQGSCKGQTIEIPYGQWSEDVEDKRLTMEDQNIAPVDVLFDLDLPKFLKLIESLLI